MENIISSYINNTSLINEEYTAHNQSYYNYHNLILYMKKIIENYFYQYSTSTDIYIKEEINISNMDYINNTQIINSVRSISDNYSFISNNNSIIDNKLDTNHASDNNVNTVRLIWIISNTIILLYILVLVAYNCYFCNEDEDSNITEYEKKLDINRNYTNASTLIKTNNESIS